MYQLILIVHIFAAICIVGLVLVQQGKGATMGAAFGSGASQTVFGSRGSGSFLLRVTIGLAILFFATSIVLNRIAVESVKKDRQADIALPINATQQPAPLPVSPSSIPMMPEVPVNK